jgi:hypothetical protein
MEGDRSVARRSTTRRNRTEETLVDDDGRRRLGVVTVFTFLFFVFVDFFVAFFDRLQFEWAGGDDFEVSAALRTGDHFPLVDFFFFDVEIVFAFGTKHHKASQAIRTLLIIFRFSAPVGQVG